MTLAVDLSVARGALKKPVPGEHEPGMLTRFAASTRIIPDGPSTLDAATIAERQREGGGAPNQRRPGRHGSPRNRIEAAISWVLQT